MADPITMAVMVGTQVLGSAMSASAQSSALRQQGKAANQNEAAAYQELQYRQEDANVQAAEQMTDRMREAARQLSMARVLSAEGVGSFAARATNVNAAEADDLSRIEASRARQMSALQSEKESVRVQADQTRKGLRQQAKAMKYSFLADVATAAGSAYVTDRRRASEIKTTKGER